jgi:N6-adenosine-specific RNA methylase IME4
LVDDDKDYGPTAKGARVEGAGVKRYRTIVADPPWPITENHPVLGAVPYETMSIEDICALPVRERVSNRDSDAHLYLWTTSTHLFEASAVAEAWGFDYVAMLVWCKPPRGSGMGCPFTSNVEFLLYGRRRGYQSVDTREPRHDIAAITARLGEITAAAGLTNSHLNALVGASDIASWWTSPLPHRCSIPKPQHWDALLAAVPTLVELDEAVKEQNARKGQARKPATPLQGRVDTRWFTWPRGAHSSKPDAFYDMVERVSPGPYLELFARRARLGDWDYWGDQSLGTAEMGGEAA